MDGATNVAGNFSKEVIDRLATMHEKNISSMGMAPPVFNPFQTVEEPAAELGAASSEQGKVKTDFPVFIQHLTVDEFDNLMSQNNVYKFDPCKKKGRALIINNQFKHGQHGEERKGSQKDYESMCTLWEKIGCKVVSHPNLSGSELRQEVKKFADGLGDVSMCVVFIGSHGGRLKGKDVIQGEDGENVLVEDLLDLFAKKEISDIPKLFLLQCCREEMVQQDWFPRRTIKNHLICYATEPGSPALRDVNEGSWFVQFVTRVFVLNCREKHVLWMMQKVKEGVEKKRTDDGQKQTCKIVDRHLEKLWYLCPGQPKTQH